MKVYVLYSIKEIFPENLRVALNKLEGKFPVTFLNIIDTNQATTLEGAAQFLRVQLDKLPLIDSTPIAFIGWKIDSVLVRELSMQMIGIGKQLLFSAAISEIPKTRKSEGLDKINQYTEDTFFSYPFHSDIGIPDSSLTSLSYVAETLQENLEQARNRVTQSWLISHEQYDPLVPIKVDAATSDALLCIPGAGNGVTSFLSFSKYVKCGSVFGLQPRGLDGALMPYVSVQAYAIAYANRIKKLHPRRPVHIIGHSFGGWIAFELALRLSEDGIDVKSLTLVDSDAPKSSEIEYHFDDVLNELVALLNLTSPEPMDIQFSHSDHSSQADKISRLHKRMVEVGFLPVRSKPSAIHGMVRTFGYALRCTYVPDSKFFGRVKIFTAAEIASPEEPTLDAALQDKTSNWLAWTPAASLHTASGNHLTMLSDPYVRNLAEEILVM